MRKSVTDLSLLEAHKMAHECIILADAPDALVELCGISVLERLLRTLQRCGIARATVLTSTPDLMAEYLANPSWPRKNLAVAVCQQTDGPVTIQTIVDLWPGNTELLLVIRGDHVFDDRLVRAFSTRDSGAILIDSESSAKLCGVAVITRDWAKTQNGSLEEALRVALEHRSLAIVDVAELPAYSPSLRRELKPFWFPAPAPTQKKQAERFLLDSVQKGTQDLPAYVHAPIERFLVSHLAKTSITPNQLTVLWAFAALITTILYATGLLVWGIVIALLVGIVDGLDGKLARLKVETTKGGKWEHRLDDFLDVAWPTALAFHFYTSGQLPSAFYCLLVLIIAEGLDGIGKLVIYSTSARLMTAPGRFDTLVRLVGGRRNIYTWVLGIALVLGAPAKSLIVMTWWEVITAMIDISHAGRLLFLRGKTR